MSRSKPRVPATKVEDKRTFELSIKERLQFAGLIPANLSYVDHILADDIRAKVWLTQEEITAADIKEQKDTAGRISGYIWKPEKEFQKTVTFTEAEFDFVKRQVQRIKDQALPVNRDLFDFMKRILEDEKTA